MHPNHRPELVLIDGATASGKSTVLSLLRERYTNSITVGSKMTTRRKRPTDNDWEFRFVDQIPGEPGIHEFHSVGNSYAIDGNAVRAASSVGVVYAVSCVDRPTVEALRAEFRTIVVYVFRQLLGGELSTILRARNESTGLHLSSRIYDVENIRFEYAAKIHLYDHVLLNIGEVEDLQLQLTSVLTLYGVHSDATDRSD